MKVGKAEINNNEITHKSLTKKRTIPLTQIREVTLQEPGTLKGGNLIITPYYDQPLIINISKKDKQDAQQAYQYLTQIAENNQPPIHELEQDPTLTTFNCFIQEERTTMFSGKKENTQKAVVKVYDDKITISKSGMFTKRDKGHKTVQFSDVTSVDLDTGVVYNFIILTMPGSPGVTLQQPDNVLAQKFYDLLSYKFNTFKQSDTSVGVQSGVGSDADDLLKWHELKEKGVISEDEFEAKKKEILGL